MAERLRRGPEPCRPGALPAVVYLEVRRAVRERDALRVRVADLRAVARPPFAPAFLTDGVRADVFLRAELVLRAPPVLRAVDLRAELVLRADVFFRAPPVLRADVLRAELVLRADVFFRAPPVLRADVFFRAPPVLRADVLRAVVLRAELVLRAVVFFRAPPVLRADVLRAELVLRAVDVLRAAVLRAAVLRPPFAPAFLTDVRPVVAVFFRAELVLRAPPDLADDVFRAELVLREEEPERAVVLLPDEREPERAEERVVAGTATARAASVLSSLDASPMAESPHVVSLSEPAIDVFDISPVPLQSSWVINDLLS